CNDRAALASSVPRPAIRMPSTVNIREHNKAPLSSAPTMTTTGRRRAAAAAKALPRISPIRRADAAIPSSITTACPLGPDRASRVGPAPPLDRVPLSTPAWRQRQTGWIAFYEIAPELSGASGLSADAGACAPPLVQCSASL